MSKLNTFYPPRKVPKNDPVWTPENTKELILKTIKKYPKIKTVEDLLFFNALSTLASQYVSKTKEHVRFWHKPIRKLSDKEYKELFKWL